MPVQFLGSSLLARQVQEAVEFAVESDLTVLLCGETGTGKEFLAQAIHEKSRRSKNPFITVNCSAMPETLVESEFFGHKRGAFTGADHPSPGLFASANGGTIFLDEIGDMSIKNQPPLLRFLSCPTEKREVRQVGGATTSHINVRVIAATNKDLQTMVEERAFRDDLYHRLNVIHIDLPPLRERKEDILSFLELFGKTNDLGFSTEVLPTLEKHDWPGNFRELAHVLEKAVDRVKFRLRKKGVDWEAGQSILIKKEDLHIEKTPKRPGRQNLSEELPPGCSLEDHIARIEREVIEKIAYEEKFNSSRMAERLGMCRKTLYLRLRKYGFPLRREPSEKVALQTA